MRNDERYGAPYRGQRGPMWGPPDSEQSFRGRGPSSYRRPDERVREDICELLTEADDVDASEIDVRVEGSVVTLEGTVESRYMKRRAESLAERVRGVRDVMNMLRVRS